MPFTHLHLHTEYSLLDGAARIDRLFQRVRELGQTACAITDHGVMYGAVDFARAAAAQGIKPIIGCEVYVARRTRHDKLHDFDRRSHHLILLCQNEIGYKNLCKLVSAAYIEGFYVKPRVDHELLEQHNEGLICLSGCMAGEIPRAILADEPDKAAALCAWYQSVFGDRFYLETQHHGIPEQEPMRRGLEQLSAQTGVALVATNDVHYIQKEDAFAQEVLMCIQTGKTLDDPTRIKFKSGELYLKSEAEMRRLFPQEVLDRTQEIADRCDFSFTFGRYVLPKFTLQPEETAPGLLRRQTEAGYATRYPSNPDGYIDRLNYELQTIESMGFCEYFLIVADFVNYAKRRNISVGPGRGSGAGSMVAYCLSITDVDPMQYALVFERFLNPERISMPDFDIDFCVERRGEVIEYVRQKYGADHVAQIVTFGTMAAKAVVRDVGRVMGISYAEIDTLAKSIPYHPHMTLDTALEESPQFRKLTTETPQFVQLLDIAKTLEGLPRHASTHAAGVVITAEPVDHYVPLAKNDENIVTQYPMTTLENLGLLKMDFLGLRNLTIMKHAAERIRRHDPSFDEDNLPTDDPAVFAMLGAGKTAGCFQLESAGMTAVCQRLQPQSIEDITALVALYRPGPMDSIPRFIECKHNPAKVTYKHPLLEPILSVTYGCIVYQEQVLSIFRELAGFSLGRADNVRRAISKKKLDVLAGEKDAFIAGCIARDVPQSVAADIFEEIIDFANYAFNKAHAVSYAVVAYRTAYFMHHHPAETTAAILTSIQGGTDRIKHYIGEAKDRNIDVLPPDITRSEAGFSVADGKILFGLSAVKNVGEKVVEHCIAERAKKPFADFADVCVRMSPFDLNRRALESMIAAGAFDVFGETRKGLTAVAADLLESAHHNRRSTMEGQMTLFGDESTVETPLISQDEWDFAEKLRREADVLGVYLSGHPLDGYAALLQQTQTRQIHHVLAEIENGVLGDRAPVRIAGILSDVRVRQTRKKSMMAYAVLEDKRAAAEFIVFPRALEQYGAALHDGRVVWVEGTVSLRDERPPQIIADRIEPLESLDPYSLLSPAPGEPPELRTLYVKVPEAELEKTITALQFFPGKTPVVVVTAETRKKFGGSTDPDPLLLETLRGWLGADCVVVK